MSGICGVVLQENTGQVSEAHLLPMVQELGPAERGEAYKVSLGAVGLGAQRFPGRLAGVATMVVHGHSVALAMHGSLYNLHEVCPPQEPDPCAGLLRQYIQEGMTLVQRLRGEFALALWDARVQTLYLATDRFRVHPLFYYQDPSTFVFASRMQGILASPFAGQRTIDPAAIVDVVVFSSISTPKTIFREVRKLPPGHLLTYCHGETRLEPYWTINFLQPDRASEAELTRQLKAAFSEALSVRVATDGKVDSLGTFLSGGVDSSTVTGVLTRLLTRPMKSFSIGFTEQRFNEMEYAQVAAHAFEAEHYTYFVSPQDAYDTIPILLAGFDEPYGNASAIPTYFCAKMAHKQGVEVLYAGDGGDELFAGNARYASQQLFEYYAAIPTWLRERLVQPLVFALANRLQQNLFVQGKKYIERAVVPLPERLSAYGPFEVMPMAAWFTNEIIAALGTDYNPYATMYEYYRQAPAQSPLDRQLYVDLQLAITDNDLFKVTRMTEAAGITVRFPFLDHRLAEFAATVPAHIKMRGRQLRSFFKRAYADLLPVAIRTKTKHGFGLPMPIWLRTDPQLNEMMHDLVLSPLTLQRGYFRKQALEELIARHKTDETSFYGTVLWHLMMLELWHRHYAALPLSRGAGTCR